jgi:hypothetical protein
MLMPIRAHVDAHPWARNSIVMATKEKPSCFAVHRLDDGRWEVSIASLLFFAFFIINNAIHNARRRRPPLLWNYGR